jgi:hypothetical protein
VQCGDLELDKEINDRVEEFCAHLHTTRETIGQVSRGGGLFSPPDRCGDNLGCLLQMRLLFYEKRQQSYFWKVLGSQDDKVRRVCADRPRLTVFGTAVQVCWEEWILPIRLVPMPAGGPRVLDEI